MVVHLTEKGKEAKEPETNYQEFLGCLSPEELQQFGEYLDRIIAAFRMGTGRSEDEDAMADWMDKARERMGDDHFEQLMSMRERAFGPFGRGAKPDNIPGAERFSPDYNGPVPDRGGFGFFDGRKRK